MLLLLVDIVTGTVLGTFNHLGFSFSSQLNADGSAQVNLAIKDWRQELSIDGLGVAKTFVYLVNPVTTNVDWWGVLWNIGVNPSAKTLQLRCSGIGSLFAARAVRDDLSWTNADQATIVQDLLEYAQTGTRRDLGIHNSLTATGVLRTRKIVGLERHYVGQLISEMSAWLNGYDFRYDAFWTGGGVAPTHQFALIYPAPAVIPTATLIARGKVIVTAWNYDGTTIASDVDSIGNQVVATRTQAPPLTTYPAIDRSVTHTTSTETANLQQWADRALSTAREPRQSGTLRALLDADDDYPVLPGQAFRLVETDLIGIDKTLVVTQMNVSQAGAGRQVDYTVADPVTLLRTAEQL